MVYITQILSPVSPSEKRRGVQSQTIEFEYSGVNWENIPDRKLVTQEEDLVAWGGYPGSYDTVETDDFKAVLGYFDSSLCDQNTIYVTDSSAYIYDFVLERVSKKDIRAEVFRVLTELSRDGMIEALRPTEEVMPPDYREFLEFHKDIKEFEIEKQNGEMICRVVPDEPYKKSELATDLHTINGVEYPKPDRIEIVSEGH